MKKIIILCIFLTELVHTGFVKNNGIVTDTSTRLEWQDKYDDNNARVKHTNWIDAINYCEDLTLNSYTDWRLPSITELGSILDYSRQNPASNVIFELINNGVFWTSTTSVSHKVSVWIVGFKDGRYYRTVKVNMGSVRCVRAGG